MKNILQACLILSLLFPGESRCQEKYNGMDAGCRIFTGYRMRKAVRSVRKISMVKRQGGMAEKGTGESAAATWAGDGN
jgi:hypothetical protein